MEVFKEQMRYYVEGHGLVGTICVTWTVGRDDLAGLFQPW